MTWQPRPDQIAKAAALLRVHLPAAQAKTTTRKTA